jgi:hypothetical protein
MPSILVYALDPDLTVLLDYLNTDPEIAFLVAAGSGRWRATSRLSQLPAAPQALWHTPSGPLPLLGRSPAEPDIPIPDPYAGWSERLPAATRDRPFFGSHPGLIWLYISLPPAADAPVPMSALGWIGNRYRASGHGATAATTRYWRRLKTWIRDRTHLVPRGGLAAHHPVEIAAFPAALAVLKSGIPGELNPPAT